MLRISYEEAVSVSNRTPEIVTVHRMANGRPSCWWGS